MYRNTTSFRYANAMYYINLNQAEIKCLIDKMRLAKEGEDIDGYLALAEQKEKLEDTNRRIRQYLEPITKE